MKPEQLKEIEQQPINNRCSECDLKHVETAEDRDRRRMEEWNSRPIARKW